MTINLNFIWIDDDPKRLSDFKDAIAGPFRDDHVEANIEAIQASESILETISGRAEKWKSAPPDLILIDHDFTKIPRRLLELQGSGLAQLIRNTLPTIPLVCATGQKVESEKFNHEDLSAYSYLFDVSQIASEENLELLFSIAKDFPLLCMGPGEAPRRKMLEALAPPELDRDPLLSVLPAEFESGYVHGTSPHRMAQWVLNVLMKKPGFLFDPLEAATFLGLTEDAFMRKVEPHFNPARYRGPFWRESQPMWWASAMPDVLYEILPESIELQTREAGRMLGGIDEGDFSRCACTGEHNPPPDVVAFTDSTRSDRKAVRHSYTEIISEEAGAHLGFAAELKIRKVR